MAVPRPARSPDASRARLHRAWATCPGEGHFTWGLTLSFPEEKQQPRACSTVARITEGQVRRAREVLSNSELLFDCVL